MSELDWNPADWNQTDLWGEAAAARYDDPSDGMTDDALLARTTSFLADLANDPAAAAGGGRALEFAIGTGRVAVPLRRRGVPVTGIELSPAMVGKLRTKMSEAQLPVIVADMVTARVEGEFSLAYLVFNTIANLLTQEDQVQCFRNAAAHLVPSGTFVIELWVPELRSLPPGASGAIFGRRTGYVGMDFIDPLRQRIESHHFTFAERGREARHAVTPHRYIWPSELDLMAQLAGFRLESRWADWSRAPFTAESTSHVSVYRLEATD